MNSSSYQKLIIRPERPRFLDAMRRISKLSYVIVTSSLLALAIAILSWVVPTPPLKEFFRWLFVAILALFAVIMLISIVIYFVQMFQYVSKLESKVLQVRKAFLVFSGIDDVKPGSEIKYHISGITDQQGTVNLIIAAADNSGLHLGSFLDVVASATGEVWGYVKISRIDNQQAWACPIDRKNPEFWERLEDRMKVDPSPPSGIHLEPLVPPAIRLLLPYIDRERKEDDA